MSPCFPTQYQMNFNDGGKFKEIMLFYLLVIVSFLKHSLSNDFKGTLILKELILTLFLNSTVWKHYYQFIYEYTCAENLNM